MASPSLGGKTRGIYSVGRNSPENTNQSLANRSLQTFSPLETVDVDIEIGNNPFSKSLGDSANPVGGSSAIPTRAMSNTKNVYFLFGVVAFGILLVTALLLAFAQLFSADSDVQYSIVMDCGSTGTRLYIYEWRGGDAGSLPEVKVMEAGREGGSGKAYNRKETEPGLDKFVGDAQTLREKALKPLLDWAAEQVPRQRHKTTPLFLFATAGLRKLPEADSLWVLEEVRNVLESSPFYFERGWARIISGIDEAMYGWIALNYVLGQFGQGHEYFSLGALDLGGSSLEVTFVPPREALSQGSANVTIKSREYHLYAHSHAGYGMNDGFDRSVTALLHAMDRNLGVKSGSVGSFGSEEHRGDELREPSKRSGRLTVAEAGGEEHGRRLRYLDAVKNRNPIIVEHPCLQNGYNVTYARSKVLMRKAAQEREEGREGRNVRKLHGSVGDASVRGETNDGESSLGLVKEEEKESYRRKAMEGVHRHRDSPAVLEEVVQLVGASNWDRCQALAAAVIRSAPKCSTQPCALGAHQPHLRGKFYALTGFFVVYHFFGLPGDAPLDALLEKARAFCGRPWMEVETELGEVRGVDRNCFRAPYVVSLLREGLGLLDSQITVGSGDMTWTLGAALYEGGSVVGSVRAKSTLPLPPERAKAADLVRQGNVGGESEGRLNQHTTRLLVMMLVVCAVGIFITVRRWTSPGGSLRRGTLVGRSSTGGQGVYASWIFDFSTSGDNSSYSGSGGRFNPGGRIGDRGKHLSHSPDRSEVLKARGARGEWAERGVAAAEEGGKGSVERSSHGGCPPQPSRNVARRTASQGDMSRFDARNDDDSKGEN